MLLLTVSDCKHPRLEAVKQQMGLSVGCLQLPTATDVKKCLTLKHSCPFKTFISFITGIKIRPNFSTCCLIFLVMSVLISRNHPLFVRKNKEWKQAIFLAANSVLSFQSCLFVQVAWLCF